MTRRTLAAGTAAVAMVALAGCSSTATDARNGATGGPRLKVVQAYVPQPPLSDMAAGYFTVLNTGRGADRLTSVTSAAASDITLMVTGSNGTMTGVHDLPIPAGGELQLHVGGDHLMLMGLKGKPMAGQHVSFELHFAKSAPITVRVPVEPATYQPKD